MDNCGGPTSRLTQGVIREHSDPLCNCPNAPCKGPDPLCDHPNVPCKGPDLLCDRTNVLCGGPDYATVSTCHAKVLTDNMTCSYLQFVLSMVLLPMGRFRLPSNTEVLSKLLSDQCRLFV